MVSNERLDNLKALDHFECSPSNTKGFAKFQGAVSINSIGNTKGGGVKVSSSSDDDRNRVVITEFLEAPPSEPLTPTMPGFLDIRPNINPTLQHVNPVELHPVLVFVGEHSSDSIRDSLIIQQKNKKNKKRVTGRQKSPTI